MDGLTRGQAAKKARVHPETLRYYERRGILPEPARSPANYRLYSEAAVRRVRFVKRAQGLGFTLREIGELIALQVKPAASCADVRGRTLAKIAEIDRKLRDMREIKRSLTRLGKACPGSGGVDLCPILDAMGSEGAS